MRDVTITRVTKETNIILKLNLDGSGIYKISTGIGFFDHMLTAFSVHANIDLEITCIGDLNVDCHHTVEDVGIVLGSAVKDALGDRSRINRYGNFSIPMDEALASCSIDLSGRAFLVFNAEFTSHMVGDLDTQMVEEFFKAFANKSENTIHINLLYGKNDHHRIEAIFKAFAHAFKIAIIENGDKTLSTKGVL